MAQSKIHCPKCGTEIELTEALTGQIEQAVKAKYETDAAAKDKEVQAKLNQLKAKEQAIDEQVAEQVKAKQKIIAEQERKKILAEHAVQTKALEEELEKKRKELSEANKKELELRRQQQKLEDEKAAFELTVQRKVDDERKTIKEQASKEAAEQQQLKLREKDEQLAVMKSQIDELQRRAEVGSQEAKGEALEDMLQDTLQRAFPLDVFEEVKKGQRGADVLQRVRNKSGKLCGTILWESKNTKEFANRWIDKLRKDQQEAKAEVAVIMTVALPEGIENFGQHQDVWITNYKSAIGLATALRQLLIEVTRQRLVSAGQADIKDLVYEYTTGKEFAMQIYAIAEAFIRMQDDLNKEKAAMEKLWKRREKQITTVLTNVAGIRGSIEGLTQKALPEAGISLEAISDNDEE